MAKAMLLLCATSLAAQSIDISRTEISYQNPEKQFPEYEEVGWVGPNYDRFFSVSLQDDDGKKFNRYKKYRRADLISSSEGVSLAAQQLSLGGLSGSVIAPIFLDSVVEKARTPRVKEEIIWNSLFFDIDRLNETGLFDISAFKRQINEQGVVVGTVTYRWQIFVKEGGLIIDEIPNPVHFDKSGNPMKYKIHARSPYIEVRSFEIDGEDVPYYNQQNGTIHPLGSVKHPNPNDCLDIDSSIPLVGSGQIDATPGNVRFCAGSCSGYMITASNGG